MKVYKANEMRVRADYLEGALADAKTAAMLRQAAGIIDCILKEVGIIEEMPTADLDGSFANQKVNGERVMAKIAFYQKVRKIVEEVHNV